MAKQRTRRSTRDVGVGSGRTAERTLARSHSTLPSDELFGNRKTCQSMARRFRRLLAAQRCAAHVNLSPRRCPELQPQEGCSHSSAAGRMTDLDPEHSLEMPVGTIDGAAARHAKHQADLWRLAMPLCADRHQPGAYRRLIQKGSMDANERRQPRRLLHRASYTSGSIRRPLATQSGRSGGHLHQG
jgi:hypothetical protein